MHEVEPSPVDEEEGIDWDGGHDVEKLSQEEARAERRTRTTSDRPGFGSGSGFGWPTPARTLRVLGAVQKWATVPPMLYLTVHYANTAIAPLATRSVAEADRLLLLTRPYYQSWPLEPLLVFVPVAAHVAAGLVRRLYRRRIDARRHGAETHADRRTIPWPKLSLTSALGYAMYPMLAAHVVVMRVTPLKIDGSSAGVGLRYFAHGIAHNPVLANLFYSVFVSVASWHVVTGAAKYLRLSSEYVVGNPLRRKRRSRLVHALAATVAAGWIAGGLGIVGRSGQGVGWEAANWDRIYRAVPVLGSFF